ncbi:protein transport protein Sec23A-like isoform X2 [Zophobas morio]|uniref:protein transport protein Sec23A-like isoform X2 n=1 Tax=Zophobas morio TaxID=2755281 RepID=UPI003082B42B
MSTSQQFIEQNEDRDGIRFSWNVWPLSRIEAQRLIVPVGCLFTPLKAFGDQIDTSYFPRIDPIRCTKNSCMAILNPYCRQQVDFQNLTWVCPFCFTRNQFPSIYGNLSEQSLPVELYPQFTTIEYRLPRAPQTLLPPIFLFVVDTVISDDSTDHQTDFSALKDTLLLSLSHIPQNALVGLITFGKMVHVHELSSTGVCSRSVVFQGTKEYSTKVIESYLDLTVPQISSNQNGAIRGSGRFLQPLGHCEMVFTSLLDELQTDPWPVPPRHRPLRSTGSALSVAVGLLENAFPNTGACLMVFVGGACTQGPGMIVPTSLSEKTRAHHDMIQKTSSASYVRKASRFYDGLATRISNVGHSVDIYSCYYDQTGIYEMKNLVNKTGGHLMLGDSFASAIFKETYLRSFSKNEKTKEYNLNFNAVLEVKTSKELKINGVVGSCVSLLKKDAHVSENEIGIGGTCAWRQGHIDPSTTLAFYFEVANPHTQSTQLPFGLIQFTTQYQAMDGSHRLRVTTVARNWSTVQAPPKFQAESFDQEAAAVLMARVAVYRSEADESLNTIRKYFDSFLQCQRFGDFIKDDPNSFALSPAFRFYPQFMYHLRRSQFLRVFNNSPDETSFYRNKLNRADVFDSLLMIQPTLQKYTLAEGCTPVALDSSALSKECILLLDSFFHIVIWYGSTIASWRAQGYQNMPEHTAFRQLLEAPVADARALISDRFPVPRFIDTDQGGSQARFLLAKVNPPTNQQLYEEVDSLLTEDVSLQEFLSHLKKLAVSSST